MILSDLIVKSRDLLKDVDRYSFTRYFGVLDGNCVFCGEYWPSGGFEVEFGHNFTAYSYLQGGEIICPYCYHMYKTQDYRKSMWTVSKGRFKQFKRLDGKKILLNPPEPPFALYFTHTWKKQGWITLMNRVNYDNNFFVVGFDYDVIFIDLKQAEDFFNLIEDLRDKKIPKTELTSGNFKTKSFEKIGEDLELMKRIESYSQDPLWGLCVFLSE